MFLNFNQRQIKKYRKIARKILELEQSISTLTHKEIQEKTTQLKEYIHDRKKILNCKMEAFALVREASSRILNMKHYEEQLIGGLALVDGNVAEMATGEGKTLTVTLAAFFKALEGKGVHVITVNEYLAKRDYEQMGKVFEYLGLTVGLNLAGMELEEKKKAYAADITYGIASEFGFDYLRDHHVYDTSDRVQREFHYAIIDEVDSILIDEARTPLILATSSLQQEYTYEQAREIIKQLKEDIHFEHNIESKTVAFTEKGITEIEHLLDIENLYDIKHHMLYHDLLQALRARVLFSKDVDYIVKEQQIKLIDKNTGRVMEGRTFNDGLHQALEAKEHLPITVENRTQSLVTLQNYFQKYPVLSGLTGTAKTEEKEFIELYGMKVVVIPTHKKRIRMDHPDEIFMTKAQKYSALVEKVKEIYQTQRPILIGTTSIEQSFEIAFYLNKTDIPFEVLNAHTVEHEVELISRAGKKGQVTIATNMAGRGTDIILEPSVTELGGLFVIGTERHESRRIDNQLIGRAGRQGEPGDTMFIISIEDDIFHVQENEVTLKKILKKSKTDRFGQIINNKKIVKYMYNQQKIQESLHFSAREYMMKVNYVVDQQRNILYEYRDILLKSTEPLTFIIECIKDTVDYYISSFGHYETREILERKLKSIIPMDIDITDFEDHFEIKEYIKKQLQSYRTLLNEIAEEQQQQIKKNGLMIIDYYWMELINTMECLKNGIFNNIYAQEDPIRVYQMEGYKQFETTVNHIKEQISVMTYQNWQVSKLIKSGHIVFEKPKN